MLSRSGQNPNLDVTQTGLQVASKTIIDVANKYKLMDHNVRKTTNERKDALSLEHHWLIDWSMNEMNKLIFIIAKIL